MAIPITKGYKSKAIIFGKNLNNLMSLLPITSKASICSVTRMVPILEVMKDPILPAIIIEINVGANSKITDCLVANPIKYLESMGWLG